MRRGGDAPGFRWFCGLDFNDKVPDRTTLVKLRGHAWGKDGVFDEVLAEVVRQCVGVGLVSGKHVAVDGTQVTARAATKSLAPVQPVESLEDYMKRFDDSDHRSDDQPPQDPPVPPSPLRQGGDPNFHGERFSNATHRSTTDPDARP